MSPASIGQKVEAVADKLLAELAEEGVHMTCGCMPLSGLDVWVIASNDQVRLQQLRRQMGESLKAYFEGNAAAFGQVATVENDQVLINEGDGFRPDQG